MALTADPGVHILDSGTVEGPPDGLPRPRYRGLPIPWITQVDQDGPRWRHVDSTRVLRCQTQWLCQSCGMPLGKNAWVVLIAGRVVLSDAALHQGCVATALRVCPHLAKADDYEVIEVAHSAIYADDEPLPVAMADYGDEVRIWTVPHP